MKVKPVAHHQAPVQQEKETIAHRLRALEKRLDKCEDLAAQALETAKDAQEKIGE